MALSNAKRPFRRTTGSRHLRTGILAAAAALALASSWPIQAQSSPAGVTAEPSRSLPEIEIRARSAPVLEPLGSELSGFSVDWLDSPLGISILGTDVLRAAGVGSWTQAIRLDSALTDFYNTTGYVQGVQVRGFVLDNLRNFRRDGLPISNHAPLALDNKERIDILKGTAGMRGGLASPGGLIDLVVKRPAAQPLAEVQAAVGGRGGSLLSVELGGTSGSSQGAPAPLAYRLNLASERLRPEVRSADGQRQLLAAALDWRPTASTLVQWEVEDARSRQPSVPGLGLLDLDGDGVGETLPDRIDPRANLNAQPWSLPFVSHSTVASLRITQRIGAEWQWRLAHQRQRIATDDRIVFPDGCSTAAVYVYPGLCANGDVDFYDFRSEGERRRLGATEWRVEGRLKLAGSEHRLNLGLLHWRYHEDYAPFQAYNYIGSGSAFGTTALAPDDSRNDKNTWRRERNREWFINDTIVLSPQWLAFAGLRQVLTERASARYDGTQALSYRQRHSLPFAAITFKPDRLSSLYFSWSRGIESEAVPNRPALFSNAGSVLPALASRQLELGARWQLQPRLLASVALFDIRKPFADDVPLADGRSERVAGARLSRHRGLELHAAGRLDARWALQASLTWLDARTIGSLVNPARIGKRSPNVAPLTLSAYAEARLNPHWVAGTSVRWQGRKPVGLDNLATLPVSWQADVQLRYTPPAGSHAWPTLRLNVENLFNRKQWQEAPTQYWGGTYLFPSPPRSVKLTAQWNL